MKLVTFNSKVLGIYLRAERLEDNTILTDKGYTKIREDDDVEVIDLTEEKVKEVQSFVKDISDGEEVSSFFEVQGGVLVKSIEALLSDIRDLRDSLLKQSDFSSGITLPDVWEANSQEVKDEWLTYRQLLRDLPESVETRDEAVDLLESPPQSPSPVI